MASEGIALMSHLKEVIEQFPAVRFQLIFIIQNRQWIVLNSATSQHGSEELNRNKWIACAQSLNSKVEAFLPLLYCINRRADTSIWSNYYKDCALGHSYDPKEIESCFYTNGIELLYESWLKYHVGDSVSDPKLTNPAVIVDGHVFTKNQTATVSDFANALCYQFMNPDTSGDISWVPAFTGFLLIQFFVLLWITKRDGLGDEYSSRSCNVLSVCFESEHNEQDNFGDIVLENWARQELPEAQVDVAVEASFSTSSSDDGEQQDSNPNDDNQITLS